MEAAATAFSIPDLLYEESVGVFILVTIVLGGGAAWLTGRAIAGTWRPVWQAVFYSLVLGFVVRFLHMALFGGTLLSLHYYAVDAAICVAFALVGFRRTRVQQMTGQYSWINTRDGLMRWRRKTP